MKPFCNILKAKRIEQNLTRKDLSRLAGVSTAALGFYETDKNDPTCPVLIQLARALHTSIDDLVGYSADPLPEYERYKRYLESIGASVREEKDGTVTVSVPLELSKNNATAVFTSKDKLRKFIKWVFNDFETEKQNMLKDKTYIHLLDYIRFFRFVESLRNNDNAPDFVKQELVPPTERESWDFAFSEEIQKMIPALKGTRQILPQVKVVDLWDGGL